MASEEMVTATAAVEAMGLVRASFQAALLARGMSIEEVTAITDEANAVKANMTLYLQALNASLSDEAE